MPVDTKASKAYTGHIYRMHSSFDDTYPYIHWSSHKNKANDWEKLDDMFAGTIPVDESYASNTEIHVVMKGQTVDVVGFEIRMLVSTKAKVCFESLGLKGVRFVPVKVNGDRWWCLIVDQIVDCLDKHKSTVEYFDDGVVMGIAKYVFARDRIVAPSLFRIPENRSPVVFATESVKEAVQVEGLVGFWFVDYETPPEGYLIS